MNHKDVPKFKMPQQRSTGTNANHLRHLLDDSVLDDATRRELMRDILETGGGRPHHPVASAAVGTDGAGVGVGAAARRCDVATTTTTSTSSAGRRDSGAQHQHHQQPLAPPTSSTSSTSMSAGRVLPKPAAVGAGGATGTEELLGVMAQRLRTLEATAQVHQKEIREKSMKATEFEDKYKAERAERLQLEEENAALRQELADIHSFLSDYGLTWVGGTTSRSRSNSPSSGVTPRGDADGARKAAGFDLYGGDFVDPTAASALAATAKPSSAPTTSTSSLPFDLELLKRNAEILTAHVGLTAFLAPSSSSSSQQPTGGGGGGGMKVLRDRDMVTVCVYADGICVNSGVFRPYGWPLCEAVLQDMLEGFYPYEFRDKYPDGFPITIVDKSTEACPLNSSSQQPSNGGGMRDINQLNAEHGCYKPLSKQAFLKKLPERYVTPSGHVVDIRKSVGALMGGDEAPHTITPQTEASRELLLRGDAVGDGGAGDAAPSVPVDGSAAAIQRSVAAVQVKLPQGHKVILHMFFHHTIADVRRELDKAAGSLLSGGKPYELATVFPRRVYDDHMQTLEACGLIPNCTMMIRYSSPSSTSTAAAS